MACGIGPVFLIAACSVALGQPYVMSTVVGGTPPMTPIAAVKASIPLPSGVAVDSSGNVYFTSGHSVFKIDSNGTLTRVAGNSRAGYSGDGGPATSAQLNGPYSLAIDRAGTLYIADGGNHRIRKVSSNGTIATLAGTGVAGYSGDGGPAISAQLNAPLGVTVDNSGNVYIADSFNQRIRKVAPEGIISTVAGDGTCCFSGDNGLAAKAQLHQPEGVAVDGAGNLYIADLGNARVRKVSPSGVISTIAGTSSSGTAGDGGPATSAQLQIPWTVAVDPTGNVYISDANRVRKVVPGGAITTVAGILTAGFSGDGGVATKAQLDQPFGVAADASGNLFIADTGSNRVRKVASGGTITTIAGDGTHNFSGDGGPAASAQIYNPQAVALGPGGSIYIADYARVRRVSSNGIITTVAGNGTPGYFGDGGPAISAQLGQTEGLALDVSTGAASGTLYLADSANHRIRSVAPSGSIVTFAGVGTAGYSGDGGPANAAQLRAPEGVAVDAGGNVYIADTGNGCIRKISSNGTITTVAGNGTQGFSGDGGAATSAQLSYPRGVIADGSGNLYIADFGNGRVRKVSANGTINTVAGSGVSDASGDGGPAVAAGLSPQGVAVDSSGNLYIADFNNLVWKVSPSGGILRIAGTGTPGYSGDGGSAVKAQVTDVRNVAVDATGNVYIADTSNYAIRQLTPVAALLTIATPSPLPPASVNAMYSQQLTATGGTSPYSWSLAGGALPPGLTLSSAGILGGTPSTAGTSTFVVQVSDSASSVATQSFTLTVTVPAITTFSQLLQGTVSLNYSQTLTASGGPLPYTWTLTAGSLPPGLSLSSGGVITGIPSAAGSYNFTVKLTDAAGVSVSQAFTLNVIEAPPLARTGVLAHIAAGGSWTTTIYLANTSSNQVAVALALHADDGSALSLPLMVAQRGETQSLTAPSLNAVMSPNSTLVIDTGAQVAATVTGWVDVLSSSSLSGFAIFRTSSDGATSEGISPLQTQFQGKIDMPYDNRAGFTTAVAVCNLSVNAAKVTATVWDPAGTQLGVQTITLPASGHTSFLLPDLFAQTAGQQGIVQFESSAGSLAGVGLRTSPTGTFISVPVSQP